jgi:hypothetical protein
VRATTVLPTRDTVNHGTPTRASATAGGDAILVAGDRLDVHQFPGQLDRIVKGTHATTLSAFL